MEKVLIKTSTPSICNSDISLSLSPTPERSSISCHSGFLSNAPMSFIKSSCEIFPYTEGPSFIISGRISSVNLRETFSVSRLLISCMNMLHTSRLRLVSSAMASSMEQSVEESLTLSGLR